MRLHYSLLAKKQMHDHGGRHIDGHFTIMFCHIIEGLLDSRVSTSEI